MNNTMTDDKPLSVDEAKERLQEALREKYEQAEGVSREGSQIVVPKHMTLNDAASALREQHEAMNTDVEGHIEIKCNTDDGLVCFNRAMRRTFGKLVGKPTMSFFGPKPPKTTTVAVGPREVEQVPVDRVDVPGLPIKMFVHEASNGIEISYYCQKKYEPLVKDIEAATREELRERSIFRGQAITSDFEFMDLAQFDTNSLVYPTGSEAQIEANILTPIQKADQCRANGVSLKRGVMLHGPYGTGKTLTALLTAKTCVDNGWTFINVKPDGDFLEALEFAKRYQPCVVFVEDIDTATNGERNHDLNLVLNTFDGVLAKDAEVMVVVTTNHIEKVTRAMLRPGRLDAIIRLAEYDQDAIIKLVHAYAQDRNGESIIEGELDEDAVYEAAHGYVPAFVAEGVKRAKLVAMGRNGGTEGITSQDIVTALDGLRPQHDLMCSEQQVSEPTLDAALRRAITDEARNGVKGLEVNYTGTDRAPIEEPSK